MQTIWRKNESENESGHGVVYNSIWYAGLKKLVKEIKNDIRMPRFFHDISLYFSNNTLFGADSCKF
jgi:hypothetical protein